MEQFDKYIDEFISKPHPNFGGLPICPFAAGARIRYGRTDNFSPLHIASIARQWDETDTSNDVLILFLDGHIDWRSLELLCEEIQNNEACETMEVFAGHPESLTQFRGVYTRRDPAINLQFNRKADLDAARGEIYDN